MSKHLKEVFASMFQVSFLETIQPEPCNVKGTMDIIVEEMQDDGKPGMKQATRFVKVCHSQNECTHYEIAIDPETGIGKITLQDVEAMKYRLVQVDECGTQMMNQDIYDIAYMVDDEVQEGDYAEVSFEKGRTHATVRIINRCMQASRLTIHKQLRNRQGNSCVLKDDMEFLVRISRSDCFERFVKLHANNNFQVEINDLRSGIYTIEEYEYCDYQPFYQLNDNAETTSTIFELKPGNNTLALINEERINTQLSIEKYVRDACGELCKPSCFEEFEMMIISDEQEEHVVLCEENDFCVTLYGLSTGYYEVHEVNCNHAMYDTTYVVNDGDESRSATLEICEGKSNEVWVINSNIECDMCNGEQESPLRICKYIRYCDGRIVKPDADCQFKVMINGCGMHEAFYLNANNNFCIDMASLCIGTYEICEISNHDYITSYSVNGAREKTSACICYDGSENYCVSIINEERNRGNIRISKYIRNEFGDLIRPEKHQCFQGSLSSYFCRHCFELNEENDFSVCFHDLRFGSYEIREEENCDYQTSYQINCEKERSVARLMIDDSYDHEVKIINSVYRSNCGILKISKFVETSCKKLVKPACDEVFEIEVEGPCFCEHYTLRANNNWCVQLEGLQEGEYEIRECYEECYDVSYIVNREIMPHAIVYMGECNQEVCIVNRPHESGSLKLNIVVRDCDGNFIKPSSQANFEILVEGSDDCCCVNLNADNDWCTVLDELCEGKYRIIQKDNMGYKVSYYIHGHEDSFGKIRLGSQDEEVTIINEETPCLGNVIVTKYIMDEDQNLLMPCPQDEFHFELRARCFCRTYTLRKRNDFCIYFDDLEEGDYEICELEEGYDVTYRIQGEIVDQACFSLGREDIHVDIINAVKTKGVLQIEKRIRKGNALLKPELHECYQILLKGKNCHEVYELNAENDFCITLCDLSRQHYEIKELNTGCHVSFDIDGSIQEDGYFLYDDETIHVTVINEEMLYGCMEINKVLANDDGCFIRPSRYDSFEILVESESFKQKVILNHDNDFCVRLYDLPQGHYEVKELNNEGFVSYMINDLPYASACVDICEEDVNITVINHPCAYGSLCFHGLIEEGGRCYEPKEQKCFTLHVHSDNYDQDIVLNSDNQFCCCLDHLQPDTYQIWGMDKESISFEIEEQCFDEHVCVELCGEEVCMDVIYHEARKADITIHKCMMDQQGNLCEPTPDACFEAVLLHDGQQQSFTLNAENHFCMRFEEQPQGAYEVKEIGCDQANYQIDQGCIQWQGCFEVQQQDVHVTIINPQKAMAWLHVEARIQDCEGRLIRPCGEDSFQVTIHGANFEKKIRLDAENSWHMKMKLEEGCYHLVQQPDSRFFDLCYLVNDEKCYEAVVNIHTEDQFISTINVENCAMGSIEVCKLIRDAEGCYCYPSPNQSFEVQVKGDNFDETITLNKENHFYASLRMLSDGWYEVYEVQGVDGVEYIVNNAAPTTKGMVHVCGNANTVNIINPAKAPMKYGSLQLTKYMSTSQGLLVKPNQGNYRIHISKPGYNELFYLNKENDYQMIIDHLDDGLYVVDEVDYEGAMYIINGGSQVDQAIVEVRGNANVVDIINEDATSHKGSITLAKFIREDGKLMRPKGNDAYVFLISRPKYNQLFTLDASNHWMITVEDLEDGDYAISETTNTDQVSYIINGASEVDHAVVHVRSNSNTVQIINTREHLSGTLELHKQMRNEEGQLVMPSPDFTARVHVSSPEYHEVITLSAQNQWTQTLRDLRPAMYVVDEINASNTVTYMVDEGSEVDRAVVHVENDSHRIDIINQEKMIGTGSMHIEKYVREGMKLRRPNGDFTASLYISKPGYQQVFTLDRSNDWMVDVNHLENGLYVLDEVGTQDQVSYIINGGNEVSNGVVSVEDNQNMVMMIDTLMKPNSSIQIAKFLRADDGTLITPSGNERFEVEVSGEHDYLNRIVLDKNNQWTMTLEQLENGYYEIHEISSQGYTVRYIVDNGLETSNASIRIMNNNHTVSIINSMDTSYGRLELTKRIKNADGTLIQPADGDVYFVEISNDDIKRRVQLDSGNMFTSVLQDLPQGEYHILEVESLGYLTTYRINGGQEQANASVMMTNGVNHEVEVINELRGNRNTIEVFKYLLDQDGNYLPPLAPNVYHFRITGLDNGIEKTYELNVDNSWHQSLRTLPSGRYQVQELGGTPNTTRYLVNSADLKDQAIFSAQAGSTTVIGIINTMESDGQGSMVLTKRIRMPYGNFIIPENGEIYTVNVHGNGFQQTITLEPENNYTFTLSNLAFGVYTVDEIVANEQVTYRVNDGIEMKTGVVNVDSSAQNTVLIINTPELTSQTSHEENNHIKVILE